MKRIVVVIFAVLALTAGAAQAQLLSAGTQELNVSGLVDFDTAAGTLIDASLFYGVFLYDYIEAGGLLGVIDDDNRTIWRFGARGEYDFDLGMEMVPYLGGAVSYAHYELDRTTPLGNTTTDNGNALVFTAEAGAKYFVTENVAVSGALVLEWATDDIFLEDENELQDTNAQLRLGMRFFF